jgi:hypothetical protein
MASNLYNQVKDAAGKAVDFGSQVAHQFNNIMNTPGGARCMGGLAVSVGGTGAVAGGGVGLVGLAGGGVGVIVTEPAGLLAGGGGGALGGLALGMTTCPGGGASGSGGSTQHGAERTEGRGVSQERYDYAKAGTKYVQEDGAAAYVKKLPSGRYDVVVENERGQTITVMTNKTSAEIREIAKIYGWR